MSDTKYRKMCDELRFTMKKTQRELHNLQAMNGTSAKEVYYRTFNGLTDVVENLQDAQLRTEAIYMDEPSEVCTLSQIRSSEVTPLKTHVALTQGKEHAE